MNRIKKFMNTIASNLKTTIVRFPIAILFLAFISTIIFIEIDGNISLDNDLLGRLAFTGIFGFFLAVAIQFKLDRYERSSKYKLVYHALPFIFATFYFFFMTTDEFTQFMFIHLFVISFALFAAYLYLPSAKNEVNFGNVALSHFKAAFTAILYGVVLYIGIAAIIGAIDLLLFNVDYEFYAHAANIVFTFFTPVYYLSLLPKFNSKDNADFEKAQISYNYPRVLEILVSYILIPLISIFTIVLMIYFIKILVTGVWPVGQVGPMILGYSAAGYFIYILGFNIQNRFSLLFRKFLPIALIPLVMMQFVSSYIRIEAYGITESRYYVVLFGIFSIVCAVMLIFNKRKNPNTIVLLAALFAILSIIPPIDAFSVSMNSQQSRLEEILSRNNMIVNNNIVPNSEISNEDKYEVTNITNYMAEMGYLGEIDWFPEKYSRDNEYYSNFERIYGFSANYNNYLPGENEPRYAYAMLDESEEISIAGFDKFINVSFYSSTKESRELGEFTLSDHYKILQKPDENGQIVLEILNDSNDVLIEVSMKELTESLFAKAGEAKSLMMPEEMTINSENERIRIRIIVNNINIDKANVEKTNINGNMFIFVAMP